MTGMDDLTVRWALNWLLAACLVLLSGMMAVRAARRGGWLRAARLRLRRGGRAFRRGTVPRDGAPLTLGEMHAFVAILRGWGQRAREPARGDRGQP